jgi:hypothetical protein
MGLSNHNSLVWFDVPPPPLIIDWQSARTYDQSFEYFAIRSADTTVRNAFISATDGNGGLTNAHHGTIAVKEVSLDHVNVNPQNNVLKLTGAPHVWTMNDSSYNGAQATPVFTSSALDPFSLTFTASGSSTIDTWSGEIPSRTDLFVPGGSTFTILRSGDITSHNAVDSLRWDRTDGNTADINGSTLSIDHSFVTFATAVTPAVTGGVVTAGMVVRNGGTLNIFGSDATEDYAHLRVEGGILIDGSTLQLADRGHLTVTDKLVLDNATVTFLDSESAINANAGIAEFRGTTTINANNPGGFTKSGFHAGFSLADPSAVVNIAGSGPSFVENYFEMGGGTVNIAGGAALTLRGTFASNPEGNINIAQNGELLIGKNYEFYTAKMNLHNDGTVNVSGQLGGGGTLSGQGNVVVDGILGVAGNQSSFTIEGNVSFMNGSALQLSINPTAHTAQHVSVHDLSLATPFNIPLTNLVLDLKNDALLSFGTKFLLVDYGTLTAGEHFVGYADGSIFTRGLNSYQIRYSDAAYSALNPSVITLTVVPKPTTGVALADGVTTGTGTSVIYPLANDGTRNTTIASVSNPAITISADGRRLLVPASFSGSFTYTTTVGDTATVNVVAGTPVATPRRYNGLLRDSGGDVAGFVTVSLSSRGIAFTSVRVGTSTGRARLSFPATANTATGTTALGGITLTRNVDGTVDASLAGNTGTLSGTIFPAATTPTPVKYHVALASIDSGIPGGGFLRASISAKGMVRVVAVMPDGPPMTSGSRVTDNGTIIFYGKQSNRVNPAGLVSGELVPANLTLTDVTGEVLWFKPAQSPGASSMHFSGVDTTLAANGSIYAGVIPPGMAGAGTVTLSGSTFGAAEVSAVNVVAGIPATPANSLDGWAGLKASVGIFRARIKLPTQTKPVTGSGIYLPKSNTAWGFFPGTTLGGRIELTVP